MLLQNQQDIASMTCWLVLRYEIFVRLAFADQSICLVVVVSYLQKIWLWLQTIMWFIFIVHFQTSLNQFALDMALVTYLVGLKHTLLHINSSCCTKWEIAFSCDPCFSAIILFLVTLLFTSPSLSMFLFFYASKYFSILSSGKLLY